MQQVDRIQLNAVIEQLIDSKGTADEARQSVYEYGRTLPVVSAVSGSLKTQTPGDSFTGYTKEQGNVQIQGDEDQVKEMRFGGEPARIGNYKLSREKERGGKFHITVGHFWKLDEETASQTEEAQVWRLACNEAGPVWFGERGSRTVWDRFGLCLRRHEFEETWGKKPGRRHPAGWEIRLTV